MMWKRVFGRAIFLLACGAILGSILGVLFELYNVGDMGQYVITLVAAIGGYFLAFRRLVDYLFGPLE